MLMNNLFGAAKSLLDELIAVPDSFCHGANTSTCMEGKIRELLRKYDAQRRADKIIVAQQLDFIKSVALSAYADGRSCPGPEMKRNLLGLTDGRWRHHLPTVSAGLKLGVIQLEGSDLDKITPYRVGKVRIDGDVIDVMYKYIDIDTIEYYRVGDDESNSSITGYKSIRS